MAEKKTKILMLMKFPLFGGGSGNYTRKLAEKLSFQKNIEVAIAAPDKRQIKKVKIFTIKPARKAVFVSHPEYPKAKRYQDLQLRNLPGYTSLFSNRLSGLSKNLNRM